jgi:hypothetical protein
VVAVPTGSLVAGSVARKVNGVGKPVSWVLHSPDAEDALGTSFAMADGLVTFRIPSLRIYTMAVIE